MQTGVGQIIPRTVCDGLGVNIHFTDPQPGEMKMLADAGFKFIRMDFDWIRIEKERGKYDFSAYERLLRACDEHGIRALFILDYANPLYDDNRSPDTDGGRAAFARWAAASVTHFKGRKILWEMYNEPNIHPFWRPKVNHDDYVKLALAVGKAIKEAAPGEMYTGPASSGIDLPFLEKCFQGGLLEYFDAVSVHPYRQTAPETVAEEYRKLRMLIRQYAPKDKQIPIFSGEWGYSSIWSAFDDDRQGKMLPRQWLTNIANDVPLSIWYDWHDDGPDPKEPEHHFGTVKHPYHKDRHPIFDPKPAYMAAKALTTQLSGFGFNKRLALDSPEDWLLLFGDARGQLKLVAWTTSREPREVHLSFGAGVFDVSDHLGGAQRRIESDAKGLKLTLSDAPQYLSPRGRIESLHRAWRWDRAPMEIVVEGPARVDVRLVAQDDLANPYPMTTSLDVGREPEPIRVRLPLKMPGAEGIAQETLVVAANPLRLSMLPGAGARIDNPSRQPLSATLKIRGHQLEVSMTQDQRELLLPIEFDVPPGEQIELVDSQGRRLLQMRMPRLQPIPLSAERFTIRAEGDAASQSIQSFQIADDLPDRPDKKELAMRIQYQFDPGWKYLCLSPGAEFQPIEGKPARLGVWIKGDGSGNIPRMRFTDSAGQTFQPDGEKLTYTDWRYVEFPLDGTRAGHWGGSKDGIVHYPIKLETLLLIDSANRGHTEGVVYITSPTLIYSD